MAVPGSPAQTDHCLNKTERKFSILQKSDPNHPMTIAITKTQLWKKHIEKWVWFIEIWTFYTFDAYQNSVIICHCGYSSILWSLSIFGIGQITHVTLAQDMQYWIIALRGNTLYTYPSLKTSVPGWPALSAVEQRYVLCLVKKNDFGMFYAAHSRISIFDHNTVTHFLFGSGHGLGLSKAILSKMRIKKLTLLKDLCSKNRLENMVLRKYDLMTQISMVWVAKGFPIDLR